MAYSNPTAWAIDGVSLQTMARNIETTAGLAPPPMRGEDVIIPGRPGQIFVPKIADSRIEEFKMWVNGGNADGSAPSSKSKREQFYDNWRELQRLMWRPGEQFTLTKRFPYNNGVKSVDARGQYESGMQPTMRGPHGAKFTWNAKLHDPYYYDQDFSAQNLNNGDNNVQIDGTAETRLVRLYIENRVGLWVRNQTLGIGMRLGTSVAGTNATLDCYNYNTSVGGANANGAITHYGSPLWMVLKPGNNVINVSSDSGSGLVQLRWKAAWL